MSRPLLKSTTTTGLATLLSRITGLLRDSFMAQVIGVGPVSDAFYVAFKIPNFLRRLFAEGAFSQSFVPVISEYKAQRGQVEVRELVAGVAGTLGGVLLLVSLAGVIAAPVIIYLFALQWGLSGGSQFDMAVQMLRWTFPYLFFISLVSLFSGVLNSYGRFFIPAFTQVLMNVVLIIAAVTFAAHSDNPGRVLAIGVFVAGAVQLLFQLPAVARLGLLSLPHWRPQLDGVRRVARLMLPGIVGSSMAQISLLLDTQIATALVTGSVSWLYFADRLMEFPLGVFSIALATVILPGLSAHHASKSAQQFSGTLDWALRLVLLLASPAAVGMLCFAGPMTAMIFGYRHFTPDDVQKTSYALMAYSWGLMGFSFVKVLVPGYYARQNTRRPVRIAMTALAVTIGLNVLVVLPASRLGFPNPHILIATSTCIGAAINTLLLWRGLTREGVLVHTPGWASFVARVVASNLIMGALLFYLAGDTAHWAAMPFIERVLRGGSGIALGAVVYFAMLYLLGMRYRPALGGGLMRLLRSLTPAAAGVAGAAGAPGYVATVGAFDGIHLGHRVLIERARLLAREAGLASMVLSFEPLPKEYLSPESPVARLTTFRERWRVLERDGPEVFCVLPFNARLRALRADQFAALMAGAGVRHLVIGHDFRAAYRGEADAAWFQQHGPSLGLAVDVVSPVRERDLRVSSGVIRDALGRGDLPQAAQLLGRPYSMIGRVVRGQQLGRSLGYPTANVRLGRRRPPMEGIFAVRVRGVESRPLPGVASLGTRPTVGGTHLLLEAHVFDFAGDLYGREIEVEFVARLREERRFDTVAAMVEQIHRDAAEARAALAQ